MSESTYAITRHIPIDANVHFQELVSSLVAPSAAKQAGYNNVNTMNDIEDNGVNI